MSGIPTRVCHGRPSKAEQDEIDRAWATCGVIFLAGLGLLVLFALFG